tara:strand:- start:210 stop:1232 length:1023 start_codon:yes stop_codon:yes gene_type:complete
MKKVMVTGGTGYLGSWIVKFLLDRGYDVQLPVRDSSKNNRHEFLIEFAKQSPGNLKIWYKANLLKEGAYLLPMQGCESVFHVASPFTIQSKKPNKELIEPAVKGTQNVLEAANQASSVKRVVLTSSVAAIYGDNIDMQEQGVERFNESYFNSSSSLNHQPYSFSKLLAEKMAWEIYQNQKKWDLVVINPSFILGPVLSKTSNSESINFMNDILKGKFYFGAPGLILSYVDVRDVALAHIVASEKESSQGRHIIANEPFSILQITNFLKELYGKQFKLPKSEAPKWLTYLIGPLFGVTRKFVKRNIGYPLSLDNEKSKQALGIEYTSIKKTLDDMVKSLIK